MIASFTPEGDTKLTVFRPATGHAITVSVRSGSPTRVVMIVSDADHAKLSRQRFEVTDLMTGMVHTLKTAPCGLGCKCAVTFA